MNTALSLDLEKRMAEKPLLYPMERIETRTAVISASLSSWTMDGVVQSTINPTQVLVMFIQSSAYQATYTSNPYELGAEFPEADGSKTKLTKVNLSLNGAPLETAPEADVQQMRMAAYRRLIDHLGESNTAVDSFITWDDFNNGGYTIFSFDVTADGRAADSSVKHVSRPGHLRLEVSLSQTLKSAVTMFVFSSFASSFTINKNRAVSYNFLA